MTTERQRLGIEVENFPNIAYNVFTLADHKRLQTAMLNAAASQIMETASLTLRHDANVIR